MLSAAGQLSLIARESNLFLLLKAFGAGVILATGFIHMFPDASDALGNSCLGKGRLHPAWHLGSHVHPVCLVLAVTFYGNA
jgi:hypothetical protein